jgi:hypothetical protein
MTNEEIFAELEKGHDRFRNRRNGRIYRIDPTQRDVLEYADATLIAFPEVPHPRKRGRAWTFIAPRNLERV